MQEPNLNPPAGPNKALVEKTSKELFAILLENELTEPEVVASIAMTLTMRLAYAAKDLEGLEKSLQRFPALFETYCRVNLANAQSAILQKQQDIKGMN